MPATVGVWPTLPEATAADVRMGQRLWVLGYPDAGGGGLTLSQGEIEGFTGQDGAAGRDFIKTDASITHGNSGGPVVDDRGYLVGIASAFRTRTSISGGNVAETTQVGMIRPLPWRATCSRSRPPAGPRARARPTSSCSPPPSRRRPRACGSRPASST